MSAVALFVITGIISLLSAKADKNIRIKPTLCRFYFWHVTTEESPTREAQSGVIVSSYTDTIWSLYITRNFLDVLLFIGMSAVVTLPKKSGTPSLFMSIFNAGVVFCCRRKYIVVSPMCNILPHAPLSYIPTGATRPVGHSCIPVDAVSEYVYAPPGHQWFSGHIAHSVAPVGK